MRLGLRLFILPSSTEYPSTRSARGDGATVFDGAGARDHGAYGPPSVACARNGGWWGCERVGRPRGRVQSAGLSVEDDGSRHSP